MEHITRLGETGPKARIFPAPEGWPIRRTAGMPCVGKPAFAPAGLGQDLDTRTPRRSQVALFITQGEHPKVIAARLDRTSVRTVLDIYGNLYGAATQRLDSQIISRLPPVDGRGLVHRLRD